MLYISRNKTKKLTSKTPVLHIKCIDMYLFIKHIYNYESQINAHQNENINYKSHFKCRAISLRI